MIIGVTGFSGAGKTTAVTALAAITGGKVIYLGKSVVAHADERAQELNSRADRRQRDGDACFVEDARTEIETALAEGKVALIDAVLCPAEQVVLMAISPLTLLQIEADSPLRLARLQLRKQRPYGESDLRARDAYEEVTLNIGEVFKNAESVIANEAGKEAFEAAVRAWWLSRPT